MIDRSKKFESELLRVKSEYPEAVLFDYDSPVAQALFKTGTARQAAERSFREGPIETYRNIWSTDPEMLSYKDTFSRAATKEFPESVDEYGRVFGNGVRSNFFEMRHVNGYPMIPATWPLNDNRLKREKEGLVDKPVADWHERLFRSFVRLTFSNVKPVPLKWRKGSSTTITEFTTSDIRKAAVAKDAISYAPYAGGLMLKGKYDEAFLRYGFGGASYVVYRNQSTDKITLNADGSFSFKQREVADLLYAVSGGRHGKLFPASKNASEITSIAGFARERKRTAMACPGTISFAVMPVAQAVRPKLYDEFAFSFHHTSRSQKQEKIRQWDAAIIADVADNDMNWPLWLAEKIWVDELGKMGYADWWLEIFKTSLKLPIYVSTPGPGQGNVLIGDWRKPDLNVGLSSGNPFTDILGTGLMSVVYAIMQIEHTDPSMARYLSEGSQDRSDQFFAQYLKGQLDYGCMSKSDDAALVWKKGESADLSKKLMEKMKNGESVSPYMRIGYEHGGAFLGDVLLYDQTRLLKNAVFIGNILSMLRNSDSPEYSVDSVRKDRSTAKRPYPGLAWKSQIDVYGSSPIYSELSDLREHHWSRAFGFSYRAMREAELKRDSDALAEALMQPRLSDGLRYSDLTPIELDVLNNPDKIHFKYSPSDIRPSVLELITTGLPLEDVEGYVKSVVGRNFLSP